MEDETLLPLHREFTDKEKLGLANARNNDLHKRLHEFLNENTRLIAENKKLQADIAEWNQGIPQSIKGIDKVTGKTYLKLLKSYNNMVVAYWRVNDELRELKKNMPSEKL